MIKNEPSRDLTAKLKASLLPLQYWSGYLFPRLPEGESLAEQLGKLINEDLASSEDKIVDWLGELEASIRSSNCDVWYYRTWGDPLVEALIRFGRQEVPSKKVVDACKKCLVATFEKIWGPSLTPNAPETKKTEQQQKVLDACKECLKATFEKILGTSLTTNAPKTKTIEQQQSESLKRFGAAFSLLMEFARLVKETSLFDQNEVKLILTRTAELLNFSSQNTNIANQRRGDEEFFFCLVAGQIIPHMMGQKEIALEDQIRNYPNALEVYLRQVNSDRTLIENLLAVLNQDGIDELYTALQTQAPGSQ